MFHDIPEAILNRMKFLEEADTRDRADGTPLAKRLKQITPEVGRFLAILAARRLPRDRDQCGLFHALARLRLPPDGAKTYYFRNPAGESRARPGDFSHRRPDGFCSIHSRRRAATGSEF
jgi:hypothetical protein